MVSFLSQIALSDKLDSPFFHYQFEPTAPILNQSQNETFIKKFEEGKVLVLDSYPLKNLDFFLSLPAKFFDEWQAPLFQRSILEEVSDSHPLTKFYNEPSLIKNFQNHATILEKELEALLHKIFPTYKYEQLMLSWRMNAMEKGFLHFDIPESDFPEHQLRLFVNLSQRARVLEFGPSLSNLIERVPEIKQWLHLPGPELIEKIKYDILKQRRYEDFVLPRHYLSLAPGSMWICNAFMITHGLVFGEKTICLEARINTQSLSDPATSFQSHLQHLRNEYLN